MKYLEVRFTISPLSETACDVLPALLADEGFETFMPSEEGLTAYVQKDCFNEESMQQAIACFPLPGTTLSYSVADAPDEDWNQTWEEEGFEPVVLDTLLCVHDTRHPAPLHCQYDILVNPRMAFGTGTHPTTQMILRHLAELPLQGLRMVDAGCGTGVLGILAMKRGAQEVLAYDIDSWSVENTAVNARLNGIGLRVKEGDSRALEGETGFDLLVANINRNILLADLPRFAQTLKPTGATLILSGFYTEDVPQLAQAASRHGFCLTANHEQDGWAMLHFTRHSQER